MLQGSLTQPLLAENKGMYVRMKGSQTEVLLPEDEREDEVVSLLVEKGDYSTNDCHVIVR